MQCFFTDSLLWPKDYKIFRKNTVLLTSQFQHLWEQKILPGNTKKYIVSEQSFRQKSFNLIAVDDQTRAILSNRSVPLKIGAMFRTVKVYNECCLSCDKQIKESTEIIFYFFPKKKFEKI